MLCPCLQEQKFSVISTVQRADVLSPNTSTVTLSMSLRDSYQVRNRLNLFREFIWNSQSPHWVFRYQPVRQFWLSSVHMIPCTMNAFKNKVRVKKYTQSQVNLDHLCAKETDQIWLKDPMHGVCSGELRNCSSIHPKNWYVVRRDRGKETLIITAKVLKYSTGHIACHEPCSWSLRLVK